MSRVTYWHHVDKKIRMHAAIFVSGGLWMLGLVVVDSFARPVPFYYVLYILLGLLISGAFYFRRMVDTFADVI